MPAKEKTNKDQPHKFRELARKLDADENEEAFDAALRKIGVAKVAVAKPKAKRAISRD
jgi:hypothetical protein